jgi:enoyl-CoA hydratase/carnithine racemase
MSNILFETIDSVCTISINRSNKKNALTQSMYKEMGDAITLAGENEDISVVLLKSDGDIFTAGNDMHDFAQANQQAQSTNDVDDNLIFMNALMNCKLPVVAQVQGLAVGIGTTLLLHCDIVIASDKSCFSMPFVDLGLVPEFASSYLVPKMAGHRKASKWLLLGETFDAGEAEMFGFATEIVEHSLLATRTSEVVKALASKPKQALLESKALMKSDDPIITKHMRDEMQVFIRMLKTDAAQEAFTAFIEKRAPNRALYR